MQKKQSEPIKRVPARVVAYGRFGSGDLEVRKNIGSNSMRLICLMLEWSDLLLLEQENINSFRGKLIKKFGNENVWFQISSELQFRRHIPNGILLRLQYAIKIIINGKDLTPLPLEKEIVSKLSRNFSDDIETVIIIRNVKIYDYLIELLNAFDQV